MTTALDLARAAARVPRYTSYPTAPHFHAGVTAAVTDGWLADLPSDTPLSLYVHIPFCDTLCWFCGCQTQVVNRYGPVRAYLGALAREMALVAEQLGPGRTLSHVHWGGGSPTLLRSADLWWLAQTIKDLWPLAPGAEFAVEIDPRGLDDLRIATMAEAGVTRASIGLQDVTPKVQRAINRIQSAEETLSAAERLRAAGIRRLNLDLLYGLPHQDDAALEATLDAALAIAPDRIALFGYAHVPHMKKHMALIDTNALPDAATRLAHADHAEARLVAAGYQRIGLDHFARSDDPMAVAARAGTLARNFQGYTVDSAPALIGLGASAISALVQGYAQNRADVRGYLSDLATGQRPVARGVALSADDQARRDVIMALMCGEAAEVPAALLASVQPALAPLLADGLAVLDGLRLSVPPAARRAVRLVAACFDAYLARGTAVHSVAV
jgi:oxygen-independent coproporphyrinogen III oxidase